MARFPFGADRRQVLNDGGYLEMRSNKIRAAIAVAVAAAAPQFAVGGSSVGVCAGGPPATCTTGGLDVTFNITIPTALRFQLGASAAVPTINWATNITATNLGSGTAIAAESTTNAGPGAGANDLYYQVISNQSANNVTIQATSATAGLISGGNTILWSQITNAHTGGAGTYALPNVGGSNTITPSGGAVNESGYVTYSFANTTTPVGGNYAGTITYTASQVQ